MLSYPRIVWLPTFPIAIATNNVYLLNDFVGYTHSLWIVLVTW
jgi:hypothetical protein